MQNHIVFVGLTLLAPIEKCSRAVQSLTGFNCFAQARLLTRILRIMTLFLSMTFAIRSRLEWAFMTFVLYIVLGVLFGLEIKAVESKIVEGKQNDHATKLDQVLARIILFLLVLANISNLLAGNPLTIFTPFLVIFTLNLHLIACTPLPARASKVREWMNKLSRHK